MSGGNPSHRGGPLVGPESYYSPSRVSRPLLLSRIHASELSAWGEAPCMDVDGQGGG